MRLSITSGSCCASSGRASSSALALLAFSLKAMRALARVAPKTLGGPHSYLVLIRIELAIHARLLVGTRNEVAEGLKHLFLGLSGQRFGAPCAANGVLRAGPVALGQKCTAKRESSLARDGPVAREGADGGNARMLLPQHRLGALAEHDQAWPTRVGDDEITISRKIGGVVVTSQDRPFCQLAGNRILDAALYIGRLLRLAAPGEIDGLFHRIQIGFWDGGGRRKWERRFVFQSDGCGRSERSGVIFRLW